MEGPRRNRLLLDAARSDSDGFESRDRIGAAYEIRTLAHHLTVEMLAERVGVSRTTYLKVEKGDPKVSMGIYAMALFVLGFPDALAQIADARKDDTGLLLEAERLPKRVRAKTKPSGL